MKIEQISVTIPSGQFFKEDLIKRWNFKEYTNIDEPCFFFGAWEQIDKINAHKGLKVLAFITPLDCTALNKIHNSHNLYIWEDPHLNSNSGFKTKKCRPEIKDYSLFKPNVLGDKIYIYMRDRNAFNYNRIENIKKSINFELLLGGSEGIGKFVSIEELKKNYYDECFVSVNLSNNLGMTTVTELGFMGRKTIMNTVYDHFTSTIKYNNDEDIIRIINEESKKIGTIQPPISCHTVNEEWLDINFWTS